MYTAKNTVVHIVLSFANSMTFRQRKKSRMSYKRSDSKRETLERPKDERQLLERLPKRERNDDVSHVLGRIMISLWFRSWDILLQEINLLTA